MLKLLPLTPPRFSSEALLLNRQRRLLSQRDLSRALLSIGYETTASSIASWEAGCVPSANAYLALTHLWGDMRYCLAFPDGLVMLSHNANLFLIHHNSQHKIVDTPFLNYQIIDDKKAICLTIDPSLFPSSIDQLK